MRRTAPFVSACWSLLACLFSVVVATPAAATPAVGATVTAALPGGVFVPLTPTRVLDTRDTGTPAAPGVVTEVGLPVVPGDAIAVELTATVTAPEADGYLTLMPPGTEPLASNLNFLAGETTANHAIVGVVDGAVAYRSSVHAHVLLDVAGYWKAAGGATNAGRFQPVAPVRALDTRAADPPFQVGDAGYSIVLTAAGVPADARAVAVNLTATEGGAAGYVTAWSQGEPPFVSNLNFGAAQTVANSALVPVFNAGGEALIRVRSSVAASIIVDVFGYVTGPSAPSRTIGQFVPTAPARIFDSRTSTGPLPGGAVVDVADPRAAGASALVLNVTVAEPAGAGYVTAFPAGGPAPFASNVNVAAPGEVRPGLAMVGSGSDGEVSLFTSGATQLIADAAGWFR